MERLSEGGGTTVTAASVIKPPFQFEERFGGLGGFLPVKECERALYLTDKQMLVLEAVAYAMNADEIAMALGLHKKSVESHLTHIKDALELETSWELRMWAVKYFVTLKAMGIEVRKIEPEKKPIARRKFLITDGAKVKP